MFRNPNLLWSNRTSNNFTVTRNKIQAPPAVVMEPDPSYVPDIPDPFAFAKAQIDDTENVPGLICEIKTYEARYDSRGDQVVLQVGKRRDLDDDEEDRDHDSALVLTRFYDHHENLDYTQLEIRSPHVIAALREVIVEYPGINLHSSKKITIPGLPKCFFHYREELNAYGLALQDPIAIQHLVFALGYMYQTLHNEIISYFHLMVTPTSAPSLAFVDLWMAFRPGILIYSKISRCCEVDHVGKVRRLKSMTRCECTKRNCEASKWRLKIEHIDYDGTNFGFSEDVYWTILPYQDYKRIDQLPLFPFEFHPDKEALSRALVARGKKFVGLQGVHHRYYEGTAKSLSPFRLNTVFGEEDEFAVQSIPVGP